MATTEAESSAANEQDQGGMDNNRSGVASAVAAAAATSVVTYAVRRAIAQRTSDHDADNSSDDDAATNAPSGVLAKKDDITEALASKVADVREKAKELRPGRHKSTVSSIASSAWGVAADHLLPAAGQAAAALGKKAAKDAPDPVRNELIPKFIDAFQNAR